MFIRLLLPALLLFIPGHDIYAQPVVKGKIYEAITDSFVAAVNVYNRNTKVSVRSDVDGNYKITAAEGEQLVFSRIGYGSDTVTVDYSMLVTQYDVTLHKKIITLKNVTVTSSYRADSLARRNYYADIYGLPGITGRNTPVHGAGISLSPFSFFSSDARKKRQLKRNLIKEEQEYYVDRTFPKPWVGIVTGLKGDSLTRFMMLYRPDYSFCRKSSKEQLLLYVSEKLKEFRKP
jgi:hypothetical protein